MGVQRSSLAIIHAHVEGRAWGRGYHVLARPLTENLTYPGFHRGGRGGLHIRGGEGEPTY